MCLVEPAGLAVAVGRGSRPDPPCRGTWSFSRSIRRVAGGDAVDKAYIY